MALWFALTVLALAAGANCEELAFPVILLCPPASSPTVAPDVTCAFRPGKQFGPFVSCSDTVKSHTVVLVDSQAQTATEVSCTAVNALDSVMVDAQSAGRFSSGNGSLVARDGYAAITLETKNGLSVDHVALVSVGSALPSHLDIYTDLIYVYQSSALITINGHTSGKPLDLFSAGLHTHFRSSPSPQYIWIRFDPLV